MDSGFGAPHRPGMTASALGVAGPGADHAFLAAELVAFARRLIERARNARTHGITMRTAWIFHVDGQRRAGALHGDGGTPALALLQRGDARGILTAVVIGLAEGTAFADRERPGSMGLRRKARAADRKRQRKHEQRAALRSHR